MQESLEVVSTFWCRITASYVIGLPVCSFWLNEDKIIQVDQKFKGKGLKIPIKLPFKSMLSLEYQCEIIILTNFYTVIKLYIIPYNLMYFITSTTNGAIWTSQAASYITYYAICTIQHSQPNRRHSLHYRYMLKNYVKYWFTIRVRIFDESTNNRVNFQRYVFFKTCECVFHLHS